MPSPGSPSARLAPRRIERSPHARRVWLFGAGADRARHVAMTQCGADVLVHDLEDLTLPERRAEARTLAAGLYQCWRDAGALVGVRINPLDGVGHIDLQSVLPARPDLIVYPKVASAHHVRALDVAVTTHEAALGIERGATEIVPVCETALGIVNVREIAGASARVRCALLGSEHLAADLGADRTRDGVELAYARRRFVLECRAAAVEPVDAAAAFSEVETVVAEAREARRLGYHTKTVLQPEHVRPVRAALAPTPLEVAHARRVVTAFETARRRGEQRVQVDGLWIDQPQYLNARRLLDDA
ncbi:CoA ester lyase [Ramlibacter sp.]|uniref:HpcH/HpaI aldolase/citrate lyase family protein n=1 Tax=Ramlibacter sp. TaxID=1917967 RepID=UPI002CAE25F1|nr:CoA ester lyase [Ramlibacter sp.]HWI84398.1 CoA ester lyase [Ramlibacter sp.]